MAQQLRDAGLEWKPALGDRFTVPDRDLDDEIFVLSNMTIQVYSMPEGRVIGFNGTTEWALDDVELEEALWLPREDQLRSLLGATFRSLSLHDQIFTVRTELLAHPSQFTAETVENAYAAALLHLLSAAR